MINRLAFVLFSTISISFANQAAFAGMDSGEAAYWDKRYETALKELLPLAQSGETKAQYLVGRIYGKGQGVKRDDAEAAKWLHLAAEKGHAKSQYVLGFIYKEGEGVEKSSEEAVKWLRMSAENGYADSQYFLGVMYEEGDGVEQSGEEAVKWYRKAALQKHASASYNLGLMYLEGALIQKELRLAIIYISRARDYGLVKATNVLAYMHLKGLGTEKDGKHAVDLLNVAAIQGYASSMYLLGTIYGEGIIVPQNPLESYKWFAMALKSHDLSADDYKLPPEMHDYVSRTLEEYRSMMTPEQIAEANRRIENNRPFYENAALLGRDAKGAIIQATSENRLKISDLPPINPEMQGINKGENQTNIMIVYPNGDSVAAHDKKGRSPAQYYEGRALVLTPKDAKDLGLGEYAPPPGGWGPQEPKR